MTIVVVGGGPTGVEMAGAVAELVRDVLVHDYPDLEVRKTARIVLIELGDRLLAAYPAGLSAVALKRLTRLGVDVRLNATVSSVSPEGAYLKDGTLIPAASVLWVAGVRAATLTDDLQVDLGPQRRVPVEKTLQLARYPHVLVAGDMSVVSQPGQVPYPMLAPVAIQQGSRAGQNILRLVRGETPQPFSYRDLGTMATIGRNSAVAKIGPLRFSGFIAWVLWLTLHLFWLIGLRNRLLVLTNWAWNYVFFDRAVRLITGPRAGSQAEPLQERTQS
jgi:NADH dehydrogenase